MYKISLILDLIGEVLIAYSVLRVHGKVLKEHKLDRAVFLSIRKEQIMVICGIILVLLGTILQIYSA